MGRKNKISSAVSENVDLPADKLDLRGERNNDRLKRVTWDPCIQVHVFESSFSGKMQRTSGTPVRRSRRLQRGAVALNMEADPVAREMTISLSDDEDEPVNAADAGLGDRNLDEQVEYLLHVLKEQQNLLKDYEQPTCSAIMKKTIKGSPGGTSEMEELTYKSLYINSLAKMKALHEEINQLYKKTEALTEANHQLHKKIEFALGKIEVYEKGHIVSSNVLEKMKGVITRSRPSCVLRAQ